MKQETRLWHIQGKVQGVFFRKSSKEKALELGITGEVYNLQNGSVGITATGTPDLLEQFKAWCKDGPPRAVVTAVTEERISFTSFNNFSIVHK